MMKGSVVLEIAYPKTWIEAVVLIAVSLIFGGSGLGHFLKTSFFIGIMPPWIPFAYFWVYITGVFEVLLAVGLWFKPYRWLSGWGLFWLCWLVFPANIYMALYPQRFSQYSLMSLYLRLPLQFVIMYGCWWLAVK
jgi:uncharacterized membrane protein